MLKKKTTYFWHLHYGNKHTKCVNFKSYLFLKLEIGLSYIIVIFNQQGTLIYVHGRVSPYSIILINYSFMKAQYSILILEDFLIPYL